MTKTIQIRVDGQTKNAVETLFDSLGLDTSTAVRMFFKAAIDAGGLPFSVKRNTPNAETLEAVEEVRNNRNLHGPYATVREAMDAMLED
jgi:DNA-damage-inducible protein J